MTALWRPGQFAKPRECLKPIFDNERALKWVFQIFDPVQTPIDTTHFSLACQHFRGSENDFGFTHNVLLPIHIDEDAGLACVLNLGKSVVHTDKNVGPRLLSRTTVITFKHSNIAYDFSHYNDSSVGMFCYFHDDFGTHHIYSFHFQKTDDGKVNIDQPTHALYEIGVPYCQFCVFRGKICQCSTKMLERSKVKVADKSLGSYTNFVSMFTAKIATVSNVYTVDETGAACFLRSEAPKQRKVTRVSAWDYIGPNFLEGIIPLKANLMNDAFNSLSHFNFSTGNQGLPVQQGLLEIRDTGKQQIDIEPIGSETPQVQQYLESLDVPQGAQCVEFVPGEDHSHQPHSSQPREKLKRFMEELEPSQHTQKSRALVEELEPSQYARHSKSFIENLVNVELKQVSSFCDAEPDTTQHNLGSLAPYFRSAASHGSRPQKSQHSIQNSDSKRMYECSYCTKKLTTKGNMVKHIKTVHEKVKNLECEICGIKFHQRFNLERHVNKIHQQCSTDNFVRRKYGR